MLIAGEYMKKEFLCQFNSRHPAWSVKEIYRD